MSQCSTNCAPCLTRSCETRWEARALFSASWGENSRWPLLLYTDVYQPPFKTQKNRHLELGNAGWGIDYWSADTISGKSASSRRVQSRNCSRRFVTVKPYSLPNWAEDAIDVLQTVRNLGPSNIKVVVYQLGSADLSSPTGKLLLSMLATVAEWKENF
ncbi:recombinase family protein [Pseudomonas arsenicoxydans]|uniref:recombinase family protein n=1 Tax=Pseudomonas arsenicoxydans TaxID=702115 RepID=UPI0036F381B5